MNVNVKKLLDEISSDKIDPKKRAAALMILIGLEQYDPDRVAKEIRKDALKFSHGFLMDEITSYEAFLILGKK